MNKYQNWINVYLSIGVSATLSWLHVTNLLNRPLLPVAPLKEAHHLKTSLDISLKTSLTMCFIIWSTSFENISPWDIKHKNILSCLCDTASSFQGSLWDSDATNMTEIGSSDHQQSWYGASGASLEVPLDDLHELSWQTWQQEAHGSKTKSDGCTCPWAQQQRGTIWCKFAHRREEEEAAWTFACIPAAWRFFDS